MGNTSTFGTFTMARLGIYVAQHALNVTGNNMTNINTRGYTRQVLDQTSMYYGSADRYQSRYDIRENGGVMAQGVYQLRDRYLDIRYRNEMTRVGESTAKLSALQQLSDIFDEVAKGEDGDGVLEARFNDFIQQIENLSKPEHSNKDDMDSIVRSAAEALVTQFHDYAKQLATLKENMTAKFRNEVEGTNALLEKIRDLNESIRSTQLFGGSALTRQDERNLLIDELSEKIGIHVIYEMEDLGDGVQVEKLKITTSGDPSRTLIDGIYGAQLTILDENNYDLSLSQLVSSKGKLMPGQPNRTEQVLSGIEAFNTSDKATWFDSNINANAKAEVDKLVKQFNEDTKYTKGNDGTKYWYDSVEEPAASGKWVIRRQELIGWEADGKTPILKDNTVNYVELKYTAQTKLSDTELSGGLQAMREMMTESGEYSTANDVALKTDDPLHYDANAGTKRGIPYYMKALDTLAKTFADLMNEANTMQPDEIFQTDENGELVVDSSTDPAHYVPRAGFEKYFETDETGKYVYETEIKDGVEVPVYETDENGDPLTVTVYETNPDGSIKYEKIDPDGGDDPDNLRPVTKEVQVAKLKVKDAYKEYMGSVLFSNNANGNDPEGITAANISVAASWESGAQRILRSKDPNADEQSTLQDNLDHMLSMLMSKHAFTTEAGGGSTYFEGTFQEMLTDTIAGTLAKDANITDTMLNNYTVTADELYLDRDAVMGADLNDETMNMMQYQKAYSAACRLMTTFDDMIDRLINGTAI